MVGTAVAPVAPGDLVGTGLDRAGPDPVGMDPVSGGPDPVSTPAFMQVSMPGTFTASTWGSGPIPGSGILSGSF